MACPQLTSQVNPLTVEDGSVGESVDVQDASSESEVIVAFESCRRQLHGYGVGGSWSEQCLPRTSTKKMSRAEVSRRRKLSVSVLFRGGVAQINR